MSDFSLIFDEDKTHRAWSSFADSVRDLGFSPETVVMNWRWYKLGYDRSIKDLRDKLKLDDLETPICRGKIWVVSHYDRHSGTQSTTHATPEAVIGEVERIKDLYVEYGMEIEWTYETRGDSYSRYHSHDDGPTITIEMKELT